jgi:hypothetical protein
MNIKAIVDKRWQDLQVSDYGKTFAFMSLEDALGKFPDATIVITISWGAVEIAKRIKELTNCQVFIV